MRTGCKRLKTRIRLRVRLIKKTKNEEYTNKKLDKIKAKMKKKTKLNQSKDKNLPDKQFDQLLPDLQEAELQNPN